MKRSTISLTMFVLLLSVLSLTSCKKYENMNIAQSGWNPSLAVPIGYAKFGVYDVLAKLDSNDLIVIDPNSGAVALVYSSTIASFDASQIVQFGSTNQFQVFTTTDFSIPVSPAFTGTANTFRNTVLTLTMPSGEEIDSAKFKNGMIEFHLESDLEHDVAATITFPGIIRNGVPISETVNLNYAGSTPVIADVQVDLAEHFADFTNAGTTVNETAIQVQASVIGTGNGISGTEELRVNTSLTSPEYYYAKGYFGQQAVGQQADTVLLRIFQNASQGVFELRDPKIDFYIENSFGFPVDINLGNLKTINVATGLETSLLNYPTAISVNYPTQLGGSDTTHFQLNTSNTDNLSTIIEPTPKYFYYEVDAEANPTNDPSIQNFIEDDSRFELKAEVQMPLDGLAYGFNVSDTVDFNFDEDTELIESVMFRTIVDNGFPVTLSTSIKALDQNGVQLFALFPATEDIVQSAEVDANGVVNKTVRKITDINLTSDQIALLGQVKKLVIFGETETYDAQNGTYVKFFDYYNIEVKLAMQVTGNIKTN